MAGELLYPEYLHEVDLRVVSLGAPLLDDIIQISACLINGKARLRVEKQAGRPTISREDERPLQVNVRSFASLSTEPWQRITENLAFERPVDEFVLQQSDYPRPGWQVAAEMPACEPVATTRFLEVIGELALQKQHRVYQELVAELGFAGQGLAL